MSSVGKNIKRGTHARGPSQPPHKDETDLEADNVTCSPSAPIPTGTAASTRICALDEASLDRVLADLHARETSDAPLSESASAFIRTYLELKRTRRTVLSAVEKYDILMSQLAWHHLQIHYETKYPHKAAKTAAAAARQQARKTNTATATNGTDGYGTSAPTAPTSALASASASAASAAAVASGHQPRKLSLAIVGGTGSSASLINNNQNNQPQLQHSSSSSVIQGVGTASGHGNENKDGNRNGANDTARGTGEAAVEVELQPYTSLNRVNPTSNALQVVTTVPTAAAAALAPGQQE